MLINKLKRADKYLSFIANKWFYIPLLAALIIYAGLWVLLPVGTFVFGFILGHCLGGMGCRL